MKHHKNTDINPNFVFEDQYSLPLFAFGKRDTKAALDYRGARYYDSDVARFLSVDPLANKYPAWSTYNYVLGNPISYIDPTGRSAENTEVSEKSKEKTLWTDAHTYLNEVFGDPNGFNSIITSKIQTRPKWIDVYNNYPMNATGTDDMSSAEVFKMVFGNQYDESTKTLKGTNISLTNGCATRVSIALIKCGIVLPADFLGQAGEFKGKGIVTSAVGLEKKLRESVFGESDEKFDMSLYTPGDVKAILNGRTGIYIMTPKPGEFVSASGHATIWTGTDVNGGHNYLNSASWVYFWELK
jgi:RHS repeat-associated protein